MKAKKPKTKSTWMKGFVIEKSTRDELDQSQLEAIAQIQASCSRNRKHSITR